MKQIGVMSMLAVLTMITAALTQEKVATPPVTPTPPSLYATGPAGSTTAPADSAAAPMAGGRVAVVDLDRAVRDVGLDFEYQGKLTAARQDVDARIQSRREQAIAEVAKLQAQLKEATDDKVKAELQKAIVAKDREFKEFQDNFQKKLSTFDLKMKQEFRAALGPSLKKLSEAHGGLILLTSNPTVAYAPPQLDLTKELIALLLANPITLSTSMPE
jgi:Skp family chaperone for outer membrane proteins